MRHFDRVSGKFQTVHFLITKRTYLFGFFSHDPEILRQLVTCTESTHSSCVASTEFLIAYLAPHFESFNIFLFFASECALLL